jgi:hypothetical protein
MKTYAIAAVTTFLFWSTGSDAFALKGRNVLRNQRVCTALDTISSEVLDEPSKHLKSERTRGSKHLKSGRRKWKRGIRYVRHKSPHEYWFDQRIHTLGNTGVTGALHAAIAALSTRVIDVLAYDGMDIRQEVSNNACLVSALVLTQSNSLTVSPSSFQDWASALRDSHQRQGQSSRPLLWSRNLHASASQRIPFCRSGHGR